MQLVFIIFPFSNSIGYKISKALVCAHTKGENCCADTKKLQLNRDAENPLELEISGQN